MTDQDKMALFKVIPSVDRLLNSPRLTGLASAHPRSLILKAVHWVLEDIRRKILEGEEFRAPGDLDFDRITDMVEETLKRMAASSLRQVINATGVIVHTNLGRSLLAEGVIRRFRAISGGYSNLEYDLDEGKRGSR